MKRCLGCLVVMMLAVFILSACDGGRDLSTPSSRLVGHWISDHEIEKGYHIEHYFTEIDPATGKGLSTEYDPRYGTVFIMTYVINSQAPEGEKLVILETAPDGMEMPRTEFEIAKDGLTAKVRKFTITYVDDKTEFDPSDRESTQIPTQAPTQTPTIDPNSTAYHPVMDGVALYETETRETLIQLLNNDELLIATDGATEVHCERLMCHVYLPRLEISGWVMITNLKPVD